MLALFKTFISALGWYLLLTLPSLFAPIMYFMSMVIAGAVCWIAGLLFILAAHLIKQMDARPQQRLTFLYYTVPIAVLVAFESVELLDLWHHIWQSEGFLLFPLAAVIAAWISMFINRNSLAEYFGKPKEMEAILQSLNIEPHNAKR